MQTLSFILCKDCNLIQSLISDNCPLVSMEDNLIKKLKSISGNILPLCCQPTIAPDTKIIQIKKSLNLLFIFNDSFICPFHVDYLTTLYCCILLSFVFANTSIHIECSLQHQWFSASSKVLVTLVTATFLPSLSSNFIKLSTCSWVIYAKLSNLLILFLINEDLVPGHKV